MLLCSASFVFSQTVSAGNALAKTTTSLPTYTCKMTKDAITIDGVLNEKIWSQIDSVSMKENVTGGTPLQATKVKATWDSTNFYAAFITQDNDIKGTFTQRDAELYNEEAVELFFDADSDQGTYIELEWNCLNTVWDGLIKNSNGSVTTDNSGWNAQGMTNAVKLRGTANNSKDTDTGMTVEIKIPWKALDTNMSKKVALPPKNNDQMRINFYRIDQRTNVATQDLSAFSPTMNGSFHTPSKFGFINFSTQVPTSVSSEGNRAGDNDRQNNMTVAALGRTVSVSYGLQGDNRVCVSVTTLNGRLVQTLYDGIQTAGNYRRIWDGKDFLGRPVALGAYCIKFANGKIEQNRLISIVK